MPDNVVQSVAWLPTEAMRMSSVKVSMLSLFYFHDLLYPEMFFFQSFAECLPEQRYARLANFASNGLRVIDEPGNLNLTNEQLCYYRTKILPHVRSLRKRKLETYKLLLQPLYDLLLNHHASQQALLCSMMQPGATLVGRFCESPDVTVTYYRNLLEETRSLESEEQLCQWFDMDFTRQLAFFPKSRVVVLLLCTIDEFLTIMTEGEFVIECCFSFDPIFLYMFAHELELPKA